MEEVEEMEEIEGTKTNSHVYIYKGYIYKRTKVHHLTGIKYLMCRVDGCKATAILNEDLTVRKITKHYHEPIQSDIEIVKFKSILKKRARDELTPLRIIFEEESIRYPLAAEELGYSSMEPSMSRSRHGSIPDIPQSLKHYCDILLTQKGNKYGMDLQIPPQPFFYQYVTATDGAEIAVFLSSRLISHLKESSLICVDSTFDLVPQHICEYYLVLIHFSYMDNIFPAVYALMTKKTDEAYICLLSCLRNQIAPDWNPTLGIAPFDEDIRRAFKIVFPTTQLSGTWFFYSQAIFQEHVSLGLFKLTKRNENAKQALRMLMCLALLPEVQIPEGLKTISIYLKENQLEEQFRPLISYMQEYWIQTVGCHVFSVYGLLMRRNNQIESFHIKVKKSIGRTKPWIWHFTLSLQKIENSEYFGFYNVHLNLNNARQRRKRIFMNQETRIKTAEDFLYKNIYTVFQFLQATAYTVDSLERTLSLFVNEIEVISFSFNNAELKSEEQSLIDNMEGNNSRSCPNPPVNIVQAPVMVIEINDLKDSEIEEGKCVSLVTDAKNVEGLCRLCFERRFTHAAVPCGHTVCEVCSQDVAITETTFLSCPFCSNEVDFFMKLCYE